MATAVRVLEALRRRSVASRSQLQADTGLSAASISRALADLRDRGLVVERDGAARIGRPPRMVELLPTAAYVMGIDAGGSRIRAVLTDLEGQPQARTTVTSKAAGRASTLLDTIASVARDLATGAGVEIAAAAAGISGIVDAGRGQVLLSPDLPGLDGCDVAAELSERLGVPVAIDNDDLLAAAGEAAVGAAQGCSEVVFLSLGFGLGAGLIVGGRPVRGARSSAGAIAYLAPDALERRASGRAIPRNYEQRVGLDGSDLTAERVFALAEQGDRTARGVIDEAVAALGDLVVDVAALLDPQIVVLGGGIVRGQPWLLERLADRASEALPFPPKIVPSALGEDAVARGAASLALTLGQRRLAGVTAEPGRLGELEFV